MNKNILLILSFLFILGCGFQPIYKSSDDVQIDNQYTIEIVNNVSREIAEEVQNNKNQNSDAKYKALLKVYEDLTPLIINTNGTIAKYRIEITINYELISLLTSEVVAESIVRGFAQYDVGTSEINNEDTKKSMIKIATRNALQLMAAKVQSTILQNHDN